jgi:hypothetical protein
MSLVFDYNHIFNVWQDYHDYSGTYYTIYNWLLKYYNELESKKDVEDLLFRFSYYKDNMKTIVDDFLFSKSYEGLRQEISSKKN